MWIECPQEGIGCGLSAHRQALDVNWVPTRRHWMWIECPQEGIGCELDAPARRLSLRVGCTERSGYQTLNTWSKSAMGSWVKLGSLWMVNCCKLFYRQSVTQTQWLVPNFNVPGMCYTIFASHTGFIFNIVFIALNASDIWVPMVGQNYIPIYTMCIQYFWQEHHQIYDEHFWCAYTVLTIPTSYPSLQCTIFWCWCATHTQTYTHTHKHTHAHKHTHTHV